MHQNTAEYVVSNYLWRVLRPSIDPTPGQILNLKCLKFADTRFSAARREGATPTPFIWPHLPRVQS